MGRFAQHYAQLTSLLVLCSHDAYADYVKEDGENDWEFHKRFWFVEDFDLRGSLSGSPDQSGPDYPMKEALLSYGLMICSQY